MVTKKQILAKLDELTDLIKSNEYEQLKKDSEELKQLKELLSHIHFKIKEVRYNEENESIQVIYELPRIELKMDANDKLSRNDFFYSTNYLDMISIEDMRKFQEFVENVKLHRQKEAR